MAFRYVIRTFTVPGVYLYEVPETLLGLEGVVRGAGGGGASGESDSRSEQCLPGPGGGGGGCSFTERMLRRDELPDQMEVIVGEGGIGGRSVTRGWNVGNDGSDSKFGEFLFAGGGGGGGRVPLGDGTYLKKIDAGGVGGYGMSRGGRGLHYKDVRRGNGGFLTYRYSRFSEADTVNEFHMAAGGGGGGHGQGHTGEWEDVEDEDTGEVIDEEWEQKDYAWRFGGSSNAVKQHETSGASGKGYQPHWATLQSGCGGNGSATEGNNGGGGGFPAGGGAGGSGAEGASASGYGGAGANGSVTVIELHEEEDY